MTNKIVLIGNLTHDPELSETSNGTPVSTFSLAVNRGYMVDGNRPVDFFNVVAWRGLGENVAKYCQKGSKVCVVGSLEIRTWEDKDGNKRYTPEVIASEVEFLSTKPVEDEEPEPAPKKGAYKKK